MTIISNFKCNLIFFNSVPQKGGTITVSPYTVSPKTLSKLFLFFNFELVTRKRNNKSLTFELVTQIVYFYFLTSS